MRFIFLILLFISLGLNGQVIRAIKTSQGQFTVGNESGAPHALDDGRGGAIGDSIYNFAGTDNVTVYNQMSASGDKGVNWRYNANASWAARNAMGVANVNGTIKMWAGQGASNYNDSWSYTPLGGWTQISASMTGFATGCQQFAYAYTSAAWGNKYLTLGGANQNDIKSSSNLTSWSSVLTLSGNMQNVQGSTATVDTINGILYHTGGLQSVTNIYPDKLYKYTLNSSGMPTLVDSMQASFLQGEWPNIVWCTWGLLYIRGTTGTNQQGVYLCKQSKNPMVAANWERLIYEIPPRHATPFFTNQSYTEAYAVMGNFWNESWLFKCISCR